jgi:ubiquinone/menaquinone biosynthesis C-methylase UbiE
MNRTTVAWEMNAQTDPHFAILTDNTRQGVWRTDDFFATGEREIDRVFAFMDDIGINANMGGRFLDLGCGVGRNTRALMKRFSSGVGIDVSPTMVFRARQYAENDSLKAEYVVNDGSNLPAIPSGSIDFLYCHIVLQHMEEKMQCQYVTEFMRVLAPEGTAAFQIPTGWTSRNPKVIFKTLTPFWIKNVYHTVMRRDIKVRVEMHVLSPDVVQAICVDGGGVVISTPYTNSTEPDCNGSIDFFDRKEAIDRIVRDTAKSQYLSQFFFVRKGAESLL